MEGLIFGILGYFMRNTYPATPSRMSVGIKKLESK